MSKREVDYNEDNKMVVSNNYVKAIHPDRMKLNSMKLFRLVITQCRLKDEGFYEYAFSISDLSNALKIDRSDIYRDTQEMCKNMMQTVLYVGDGNPKHDWKLKHIFEKCEYSSKNESVTIQLHKDMTALFLELRRNFTEIPIAPLLLMKSKYGIRIYELICEKMMHCYPHSGNSTEIQISQEDVRKVTRTEKTKAYDKISNLKSKVLNPSLADIERAAEWKIVCTDIKRGRRIIGFNLQIWTAIGYAMIEKCKAEGKLPPGEPPKQIHGQMSLFD